MDRNLSIDHDDDQADRSNKRPRIETQEVAATAAQRFFNTTELVHLVLGYLSKDRIDLLALSLVSKALRAQALRIWVRRLEIPVEDAPGRLNFFKANSTLLEHVRYLKLWHIHDGDECVPFCDQQVCDRAWEALNELLEMFASESASASRPPLLDISIYTPDPLCLPEILSQQVVSLDIRGYFREFRGDEDQEASVQPPPPTLIFKRVADIIQNARRGPGLRRFEFHDAPIRSWAQASEMEQIWQQVAHHANTLRQLGMQLNVSMFPAAISKTPFGQLEEFSLRLESEGSVQLVENFLDGAMNLRVLAIYTKEPISLRQTFPHLRLIELEEAQLDTGAAKEFAIRHPKLVCFSDKDDFDTTTAPALYSAFSLPEFLPDLAHMEIRDPWELQRHLEAGRSFAHLLMFRSFGDTQVSSLSRLHSNSRAAQRLTCLDLDLTRHTLLQLPSMLDSDHLPNLAELHLAVSQDGLEAFGWNRNFEPGIAQIMAALTSARSLKVLRIYGSNHVMLRKDILRDSEFPPDLEYLWLSDQYFRFVSSHPDAHNVMTETGGKRGRLQRVPGIFRHRLTTEGVWHRPLLMVTTAIDTYLDHVGLYLTLSLD